MRELQRMIDRTAKAGREYFDAQRVLMEHCRETYGFEPGDVDADDIIDAVLGGAGTPSGMAASDFDRIMRERSA